MPKPLADARQVAHLKLARTIARAELNRDRCRHHVRHVEALGQYAGGAQERLRLAEERLDALRRRLSQLRQRYPRILLPRLCGLVRMETSIQVARIVSR